MRHIPQFEANVVRHCNNRCVACSHASPFQPLGYEMSAATLERDLKAMARVVHADKFKLLGGEPLLHSDLLGLLKVAKASGVADVVNVTTNGKLLSRQPDAFWKAIDNLYLSVYPNLDPEVEPMARRKCAEHGVTIDVMVTNSFFLQFKRVPDDGRNSFACCNWRHHCWMVHEGKLYLCPQAAFFTDRFMGLPQDFDGLSLDGITDESLAAYVGRTEPFAACRVCRSTSHQTPWAQAASEAEWIEASTHKT